MTRRRRGRGGATAPGGASVLEGAAAGASLGAPSTAVSAAQQAAALKAGRRWYKADLHTHTPASNDYEESGVTYLDWLRTAAERGLDIVAVTDHNTVAGVAAMRREIEWLLRLREQGRLTEAERATLYEWTELSNRVLVLPGFEFTATFGFHILGIFPPETSVRTLEHVLLSLKVPPDKIDIGSTETGSTTDVLTAYKTIHDAGGLVIAAHANSTHGVAMRNFPFGGQTKIAFTQDPNLDALEVTDLESRTHSTARFFNGSKSEYPRHMHALQGSDAHRLSTDPHNPKRLGVGERATELLLDEPSFEAIVALLRGTQWERTRPARPKERTADPLAVARAEGNTALQSFHEFAHKQGGRLDAVLDDLCAFANTAGGHVYVGTSLRRDGPRALAHPKPVEEGIVDAVEARIAPPIDLQIETIPVEGGAVLRLRVSRGEERPHAVDGRRILVRAGAATAPADRDEIVAMVLESAGLEAEAVRAQPQQQPMQHKGPAPAHDVPATGAGRTAPAERKAGGRDTKKTDAAPAQAAGAGGKTASAAPKPAGRQPVAPKAPAPQPAVAKPAAQQPPTPKPAAQQPIAPVTPKAVAPVGPPPITPTVARPARSPVAPPQVSTPQGSPPEVTMLPATPPAATLPPQDIPPAKADAAPATPTKRTRKKAATTPAVLEAPAPASMAAAEKTAAEKTAAGKAVVDKAAAPALPAATETPAVADSEAPVAEAAPAKKTRSRKKVADSPTEAPAVAQAGPIAASPAVAAPGANLQTGDTPAETFAEPEPKPKRTRRTTKAAAAPLDAAPDTGTVEAPVVVAEGEAAEGEAAATPAAPATPAKRTRKGSTGSKAGAKSAPPAPESAPPAIPPAAHPTTSPPQIGVEILESEVRNGARLHTIRDLRNGNTVRGVSRKSARDLWSYAIDRHEKRGVDPESLEWHGDTALVYAETRAGKVRYDLALREGEKVRVFYGVTPDGMQGPWAIYLQEDGS